MLNFSKINIIIIYLIFLFISFFSVLNLQNEESLFINKKVNKELLSYILFDSKDEEEYKRAIKEEIDDSFSNFNKERLYFVVKSSRKTLRLAKKYIRYSKKKTTEAEVLLYFCSKLKQLMATHKTSQQLINIYQRQLDVVRKATLSLHEDLQFDYNNEIEDLEKLLLVQFLEIL